jgi:hypothetical protein
MPYVNLFHIRLPRWSQALDRVPDTTLLAIVRTSVRSAENVMSSVRKLHVRHDICDFHFIARAWQRISRGRRAGITDDGELEKNDD